MKFVSELGFLDKVEVKICFYLEKLFVEIGDSIVLELDLRSVISVRIVRMVWDLLEFSEVLDLLGVYEMFVDNLFVDW